MELLFSECSRAAVVGQISRVFLEEINALECVFSSEEVREYKTIRVL